MTCSLADLYDDYSDDDGYDDYDDDGYDDDGYDDDGYDDDGYDDDDSVDDTLVWCTECNSGYDLDWTTWTCHVNDCSSIDNCELCDAIDTSECDLCAYGYHPSSDFKSCDANLANCGY